MTLIWILVLSNALGPAHAGRAWTSNPPNLAYARMRINGNAMGLCLWKFYELSMSHQTIYLCTYLFISVCMSFGLYAELMNGVT